MYVHSKYSFLILDQSLLTLPEHEYAGMIKIKEDQVTLLEKWIDEITEKYFQNFALSVLPGGTVLNSWFHIARCFM